MSHASGSVLEIDELPVATPLGNRVSVCVKVVVAESAWTPLSATPKRSARGAIILYGI